MYKHLVSCNSPNGRRFVQAVRYMTAEKCLKEAEFKPWLNIDANVGLLDKIWGLHVVQKLDQPVTQLQPIIHRRNN